MGPVITIRQSHPQIADRVVHQGQQPTDHLQGPAMEAWPLPVRAVFVVTVGSRVHKLVMNADPVTLLVVLPLTEVDHPLGRLGDRGGIHRAPPPWPGTYT